MPHLLDPARWLGLAATLPRPSAIIALVLALSVLVLGVRLFRLYAGLMLGLAGYLGGVTLAHLMFVRPGYVAWPLCLAAAAAALYSPGRVLLGIAGVALGALGGLLAAHGLSMPAYYWAGFTLGAVLGVAVALFFRRLATALVCAAVGSAAVVASLGAVVRAPAGPFAPGAYAHYPIAFSVAGFVLFLAALIVQSALAERGAGSTSGGLRL